MSQEPIALIGWGCVFENAHFQFDYIEEDGCLFENHGDLGPCYAVIRASIQSVNWEAPLPLSLNTRTPVSPQWGFALQAFCRKYQLCPSKEASWFLAAYLQ